jgi:arsenical pump membrane protein
MIFDLEVIGTILVFLMTMGIIFVRPRGLNEVYPAAIGALIIILMGVVSYPDLVDIIKKIGDASVTIISTIVMAVILESFGFFHWQQLDWQVLQGFRIWFILVYTTTVLSHDTSFQ